ncbi:hypothetical protein AM593_00343, partial [Mytilus galloprovincialis]
LKEIYQSSKALPMVSIKCSPYHVKDKVVIMGDAAHAMVPFYGQGMNCGFEDCIVLNDMLDKHSDDLELALKAYTEHRNPDAKAIVDLAMYNYVEMRKSVNSKMFLLRKKIDNMLHWIFPNSWVPLYTMFLVKILKAIATREKLTLEKITRTVSFSRERYHLCIAKRQKQDKVLSSFIQVGVVSLMVGGFLLVRRLNQTTDIRENSIVLPSLILALENDEIKLLILAFIKRMVNGVRLKHPRRWSTTSHVGES